MTDEPFALAFDQLPEILPVFPLSSALLLPLCRLPLNIFEPRYIAMVEAALGASRLIGMIQPVEEDAGKEEPALCTIGCAGRISSFSETDDGRILLILTGVCRFEVEAELDVTTPFRQVRPDWSRFRNDIDRPGEEPIDRDRLFETLRAYLDARGLETDWESLETSDDQRLVNSLAMSCPFSVSEQQALLEAETVRDRARLIASLMELQTLGSFDDSGSPH